VSRNRISKEGENDYGSFLFPSKKAKAVGDRQRAAL